MAWTLKNYSALLSDSATVAAQPTSGSAMRIDGLTLTNNHSAAVTVTLWITAGGSPSNTNKLLAARSIPTAVSVLIREALGQVVPDGGSLYAQASVASVMTLLVGGSEQTV